MSLSTKNDHMRIRKKLIEVALPLNIINKASSREKSIRHGHPSTLHLWWARRPLATARAVIFAQMVDDPSEYLEVLLSDPRKKRAAEAELKKRLARQVSAGTDGSTKVSLEGVIAELERDRLFAIIEDLVLWENTANERVLQRARDEIWQSWRRVCAENAGHPRATELFDRHTLPGFHDPFAGGGALPLEAQRLGLDSYASDLNPVAVLINKAMIEIPPKFAGRPPANPEARRSKSLFDRTWRGAEGLAEDVRFYGKWMRDEAERRIGHLYPKYEIRATMAKDRPDLEQYEGRKLTVIAWIWVRTVNSPNPAFANVDVPLASSFMLSTRKGREAYVLPVIENGGYRFIAKVGKPNNAKATKEGTKSGRGANFRCLMSGTPIAGDYIKAEGKAGRMGARLMTIVAEGNRERVYLSPNQDHEEAAKHASPKWRPEIAISGSTQYIGVKLYGMERFDQLFTERQLVALKTVSDVAAEAQRLVRHDATNSDLQDDGVHLKDGGTGATAYGEAIALYLAIILDKAADRWSNICTWDASATTIRNVFSRQAIPMAWDYAETNGFSNSTGSLSNCINWVQNALLRLPIDGAGGCSKQCDAQTQKYSANRIISSDPPYYDNNPYADLSDYFYVWLRRSLQPIFPSLFATIAVPKAEELVAFAYRHDGKDKAAAFFLSGMKLAMRRLAEQAHLAYPVTIYYAFKQSESKRDAGTASTGWETFLEAMVQAGLAITGTWPMRTEMANRQRSLASNALASSIVLVCRRIPANTRNVTRRKFASTLTAELSQALIHLQRSNIAPVDLAQAAIGPGMAVYTRYGMVLNVEGNRLSVREALALINQTLDELLAEQEGDFDADSRWALAWFEQCGFDEGEYGTAETLSKAKNTSVDGLVSAGILTSSAGKVRLLKPEELPDDWNPSTDDRLTAWEAVHHLIRVLETGGESSAAEIAAKLGAGAEVARELCYRLYNLCERKKRAVEALSYNGLVQSWPEIVRLARIDRTLEGEQAALFERDEAPV